MSQFNHKQSHRQGFNFYKLPVAVQNVFYKIRNSLDRYARINYSTGVITYTTKDAPKHVKAFSQAQSKQLATDLWGTV